MDRSEDPKNEETWDELKQRHGKERKELLAKQTSLKHALTKNDKKRKKEVGQQCEQMEDEQKRRHEKEMLELRDRIGATQLENGAEEVGETAEQSRTKTETIYWLSEDISAQNLEMIHLDNPSTDTLATEEKSFFKEVKLTKTQLKKERKRVEKVIAQNKAEAEDAVNALNSPGNLEIEAIKQFLAEKALELVEVPPDGDCLYSAMAHQANVSGLGKFSALEMRRMAADYIRKHRDEFLPFLVDEMSGNGMDFDDYCSKVAQMCVRGGSWGGEPELHALSSALQRPVEVLGASGETTEFGESFSGHPLIVTYHKFAFTLGEHYNSTRPAAD